ncbi:MAG: DUF5018 domain-containing protein [Bacteroidales bacterium]|nr:DUF5018 domain-containing protein [Bacteroidales bacterium]
MRKFYLFSFVLLITLFTNVTWAQSLLFEENFDYPAGQLTDVNGGANVSGGNWISYSGTASPLMVSAGSLTYAGYISSGIGNKVEVLYGTAEDAYRQFTTQTPGSTIYAAFIMNVSQTTGLTANTSTTGDYTISLTPSTSTSTLVGRVSLRAGSAANTFNIGIRATSSNSAANWISTDFPIGTPVLVVLKYELISGNTNDVASIWVNPAIGTTEPTADATQTSALTTDPADLARITLRQGTNSFPGQIDGIRVATSWGALFPVPIDWANLQWPPNGNISLGQNFEVYAQTWINGVTNQAGATPGLQAWIGYNTSNTNPNTWTNWVPATFNLDYNNNDEFMANLGTAITTPGTYYYASRFQYNDGNYYYGGYNGGFWDGINNINGVLTIKNTDATLSDLTIDGTTVSGFDANTYTYNVVLPYGTTIIPTVAATTNDPNANAVVTQASSLPGSATILVTAEDGTTTLTYTINFSVAAALSSDATLSDLTVNGTTVSGFDANTFTYNVVLPYGTTTIPTVAATPNDPNANAVVTQASSLPGSATVVVTAENGTTTLTYTINFTIALNNDATLSDLTIDGTTVNGFAANIYTYDVVLPYGTTTIPTVAATPNDPNANAVVTQASSLPGIATVVVTAEDGTTTLTYTINFSVAAPTAETLVEWTFPNNPDDSLADGGISANLNKIITCTATGTLAFNVSGATTTAATSTGWDNGMDTKYWMIDFTTAGYKDITLSSKQRSSGTGPKEFKVQYSLDGTNWIDITTITVANDFIAGVINDVTLPATCNNQNQVFVRWVMASNNSVGGSTVASTGTSRIDDIYVKGIAFLSNEAEILSFNIPGQISSNINSTNATVDVLMPYGTNLTNLVPTITISAGATINPASGIAQDFTNPVTYTVTAADNTTKTWTVNVTTAAPSNEAEILTFDIPSQLSSTINSTNATVDIIMPIGTNVTNLIPTITVSPFATINPASGVAQDFTNPVTYTVTAQDNSTKTWTVTVTTQLNNQAEIVSFDIPNQVSSTINSTNATVDIVMPYGTDVTALVPTITVSQGASISPLSGVAQDFTNPVQYTVTAENGVNQKVWTVTVSLDAPVYTSIVEWTFPNNPDDSIADGGIAANLNRILTTTATGTLSFTYSGASTYCARINGWDAGTDTKYWQVDFTTIGYKEINVSSKQRSSSTGPRDFKLQYMLNNDGNWMDVNAATITCADNWTSGVLNQINLPATCNQQNLVSLRWIMVSDTSVSGATVASTGTSRIDDIIIKGIQEPVTIQSIDKESIKIYPNPSTDWLYIQSTDKITNVTVISLDGKIIPVQFTNEAIDVHSLTTGMYLLNISTNNHTYKVNFIKQ